MSLKYKIRHFLVFFLLTQKADCNFITKVHEMKKKLRSFVKYMTTYQQYLTQIFNIFQLCIWIISLKLSVGIFKIALQPNLSYFICFNN